MGTLSFEEFVSALGEGELYRNAEADGGSEPSVYERLKEYFDIYQKIGDYLCLRERMQKRREIAGNVPWFALYQKIKGELDFYVRSLVDYKNYGIEVKSTDAIAKTAKRLLEVGKLDYLYLLKGDTKGGTSRDGKADLKNKSKLLTLK